MWGFKMEYMDHMLLYILEITNGFVVSYDQYCDTLTHTIFFSLSHSVHEFGNLVPFSGQVDPIITNAYNQLNIMSWQMLLKR